MRKRALLVLLMLAASLSILSAAHDGSIGITIAPESYWNLDASTNSGNTKLYLMVDGANYWGRTHSFGIEYGIGTAFYLNTWNGNTTLSYDDFREAFVFTIGPGYRFELSDMIGINAGLGFRGRLTGWSGASSTGESTNISYNFDFYGKVAADFTFFKHLRVDAGIMIGCPIAPETVFRFSSDDFIVDNYDNQAFFLVPFVGISFAY